ncbi:MAG: response regulator [Magnetococcales bacterium]|nr:response regulator [Magnetococcales bacterium]
MVDPLNVGDSLPCILVTDDDPDMRLLLSRFLEKNGFLPLLAESGHQAIQMFRTRRPDLVLMDANMPGMSGFQATQELCKLDTDKRVPIIMVTGLADEESVDQAFRLGVEEFITKPINWALLRHRIANLLQRRHLERKILESEGRFRSIVHSSAHAIVTADAEGRIILWNRSAQEAFGYTETEVLHQSLTMLMPQRLRSSHLLGFGRAVGSRELCLSGTTVELVGLHKGGEEFPLEATLAMWEAGGQLFFSGKRGQLRLDQQLPISPNVNGWSRNGSGPCRIVWPSVLCWRLLWNPSR